MKIVKLPSYDFGGYSYKNVCVFLDCEGRLIMLPTLFTLSSRVNLVSYKVDKIEGRNGVIEFRVKEGDLSDSTLDAYIPPIKKYLLYLESIDKEQKTEIPSLLHGSSHASSKFINHYINEVLAPKLNNISTLNVHVAALTFFYGWMWNSGLCERMELKLKVRIKQEISGRTGGQDKISYLSREVRELLKKEANKTSLRDFLILKMGWSVGLRAKENQGLLINDFYVGNKKCDGLKTLIAKMKSNENKEYFQYHLSSKFTKNSSQRQVYLSRNILKLIERYIDTERHTHVEMGKKIMQEKEETRISKLKKGLNTSRSPIKFIEHDSLFVNMDNVFIGQKISSGCASNVFTKIRKKIPQMNQKLSYHDCRHTFATELYHSMKQKTGSSNAALLEVAIRLGHSLRKGKPQEVTTKYIRLHGVMVSEEQL
ncbi:site-specific integrase [Shewanella sp. ALD9]|uniref:tyrosine-type recombinase/integrase n=1 Tax=Shewanella sp. ALD9 TaxID=2058330 RepID=UPI000C337BF7|nr:site-specific integrase [Shewanella sp. ALD9]PKH31983.1 hypothetical protein CXF88_08790 [Shewanella sp. ALD9]